MAPPFTRADPRITRPWIVRLRYAAAPGPGLAVPPSVIAVSNAWLTGRTCDKTAVGSASAAIGWMFVESR
ncbi:MAG: hypothetical protein R2729_31115 [Bryobacteraceae bacterium]